MITEQSYFDSNKMDQSQKLSTIASPDQLKNMCKFLQELCISSDRFALMDAVDRTTLIQFISTINNMI